MTQVVLQPIDRPHFRWQFNLRSIFLLTLSAGALSALYRVAAQLDVLALGTAAAVWSTYGAIRARRRVHRVSVSAWVTLASSWAAFYIVSVGPAIVIVHRFPQIEGMFDAVYFPLNWLFDHTRFRAPLEWYAAFWWGLW